MYVTMSSKYFQIFDLNGCPRIPKWKLYQTHWTGPLHLSLFNTCTRATQLWKVAAYIFPKGSKLFFINSKRSFLNQPRHLIFEVNGCYSDRIWCGFYSCDWQRHSSRGEVKDQQTTSVSLHRRKRRYSSSIYCNFGSIAADIHYTWTPILTISTWPLLGCCNHVFSIVAYNDSPDMPKGYVRALYCSTYWNMHACGKLWCTPVSVT